MEIVKPEHSSLGVHLVEDPRALRNTEPTRDTLEKGGGPSFRGSPGVNFKMRKTVNRLRDRHGQTMIMLTLAFAVMLSVMGLIFDGGRIYFEKRSMQAAADAGAFAAVQELRRGHRDADTQVKPAARRDAELNGYDATNSTVTVEYPSTDPTYPGVNYVVVTIERPVATTFMRIVNRTSATVRARAIGAILVGGDPCVVALRDDGSSNTLNVTGAGGLDADCGLYVNANGSGALNVPNNGGGVTASWAGVVGGYTGSNYNIPGGIMSATTGFDMPAIVDPMVGIEDPNLNGLPTREEKGYCDQGGSRPVTNAGPNSTCTPRYFLPGTYPRRIQLTGSGVAIFQPGLYNLESGMVINGSWNLSGAGVTFYLNGGGQASKGLDLRTDGLVELRAPTAEEVLVTGGVQGILFFGARGNAYQTGNNTVGTAQSGSFFSGAVYFPDEDINWAGNSDTLNSGDDFSMMIAETINIAGSSNSVFRRPTSESAAPKIYKAVLVQ